jgi:hypothetical protein
MKYTLTLNNSKHEIELQPIDKQSIQVICPSANIHQPFLKEDISALFLDLPELILAEEKHRKAPKEIIRFRVSGSEKQHIQQNAQKLGFTNVSTYLRHVALGG